MKFGVCNGAKIWKICSSIEQSERRKIRKRAKITILPAASRFGNSLYFIVQKFIEPRYLAIKNSKEIKH